MSLGSSDQAKYQAEADSVKFKRAEEELRRKLLTLLAPPKAIQKKPRTHPPAIHLKSCSEIWPCGRVRRHRVAANRDSPSQAPRHLELPLMATASGIDTNSDSITKIPTGQVGKDQLAERKL